ncbi:hydrogenase formation protein HypD [Alienimonas sp. DA493]|uniref:hydrogenase formation protein HypD n=1 Tax=Alienimonas sp. DA493 TaxID=3373605 RepID=UPI003754E7CF
MKFREEYRDPRAAETLRRALRRVTTRPWTVMEVCGGQTHAIARYGLGEMLPPEIELVHGPGCPVCVTPVELLDHAHEIAARPDVIFCSFGDMLRVPGSRGDLFGVKADGGDVRIVYSPLDCLRIARRNTDRTVVFFAVGFETTAPANAMAVRQAQRLGITNFAALVSHVLVPPAMAAILSSPTNRVRGFLGPGHVCSVMGCAEYEGLSRRFDVPVVVTGFEPLDLLEGVFRCVSMLEAGRTGVENRYARAVPEDGNPSARRLLEEVFEVTDRMWRGIGKIPASGLRLAPAYAQFDAAQRFPLRQAAGGESTDCLSGLILQGLKKPPECPEFGTTCTPERPLGATMVSSEGACAAYYHYAPHRGRNPAKTDPTTGAAGA